MSAPQWLLALGIPEGCVSNSSSAEERGRRFSIHSQPGDEIWRVHVDGCWVCDNVKRVDYLFWGRSAAGRRVVLLVELKGQDFGRALQQIESTLQRLCKRSGGNIIHTGQHRASLGHEPHGTGGVRAYVVLSKGSGVPQRQREREKLRARYGVIVYHREQRIEANGLDHLLGRFHRQNPGL